MPLITIVLLVIMNTAALYTFFAAQWTMQDINAHLWSFLQISFEPSVYSPIAIILFLASQLLLLGIVYFYGAYHRRLASRMRIFKQKNKDLSAKQSATEQLVRTQAKNLAKAEGIEERVHVLESANEELTALLYVKEKELLLLKKTSTLSSGRLALLQKRVSDWFAAIKKTR